MPNQRRRSRRARRRRALRFAAIGLLILLLGVAALAARDALAVRSQVLRARGVLASLEGATDTLASTEGRRAAIERIDRAQSDLARAEATAKGSLPLRIAALAPGAGHQLAGVVQLIDDGRAAAAATREVLVAAEALQGQRIQQGAVPLEGMERFEHVLRRSAREFRRITRGERGLWGQLGDARRELDEVAGPGAARAQNAADAAGALRGFFGQGGTRRYFVAGLNNAEMRDQGMVLSFAVARFEGGRMTVERTGPIETLELTRPVPIELPEGTAAVFGALRPTEQWRSVNASADFPLTARTIVAMYAQATGQQLDGVIALDVPALAGMLAVLGPVEVPAFGTLSADTAPRFLLSGQYDGLTAGSPQQARRERVADVAAVVADRLRAGDIDAVALGRRMADASAGRHLMLWSAAAEEASAFARVGLGGGLVGDTEDRPDRTFHVAVQEAGATKLDYVVRPHITLEVNLTRGGRAVVRTKVSIRNEAPVGAAPSYALGPNSAATSKPGQYVARVYLWGPRGSSQLDSVAESGLQLSQQPLLVEPGATGEVTFETVIPNAIEAGKLDLRVVPQPRHIAVPLTATLRERGREHPPITVHLDKTRLISWKTAR